MKSCILFLSILAIQLDAQTFDEFRKQFINDQSDFIVEAIEIANKTGEFAIPKPELEKSARELRAKGLEQFLCDNEECAYYPQEDRCLLHYHLTRFLNMPKSEAIAQVESALKKTEEKAAYEKQWFENCRDADMEQESENRSNKIQDGLTLLQQFLELAKDTE